MKPRKCMTVSREEQVDRMFDSFIRDKRQAYEEVRKGKVKGRTDLNGDVTVIVDTISSVTYGQGFIRYSGI